MCPWCSVIIPVATLGCSPGGHGLDHGTTRLLGLEGAEVVSVVLPADPAVRGPGPGPVRHHGAHATVPLSSSISLVATKTRLHRCRDTTSLTAYVYTPTSATSTVVKPKPSARRLMP
jgi:hypothetical protein